MKASVNPEFSKLLLEQEKEKFLRLKELYALELKDFQRIRFDLQERISQKEKSVSELEENGKLLHVVNEGLELDNDALSKKLHTIEVDIIEIQKEETNELARLRQKVDLLKMELRVRSEENERSLKKLKEESDTLKIEKQLSLSSRLKQLHEQKHGLLLQNSILDEEITRMQEIFTKMKIDDIQQIEEAEEEAKYECRQNFEVQLNDILRNEVELETSIKSLESILHQNLELCKSKISSLASNVNENQNTLIDSFFQGSSKAKTLGSKLIEGELLAMSKQRIAFECFTHERNNCFMRVCLREFANLKSEELEKLNSIRNDTIGELNNSIGMKRRKLADLEKVFSDEQLELERLKLESGKLAEILVHSVNTEIIATLRNL
jgi:hypothetical protein